MSQQLTASSTEEIRAWIVIAAGEDRVFAGHDGYPDIIDRTYHWDSRVPNHAKIEVGDVIVLRDSQQLLGASVIEDIQIEYEVSKSLNLCPSCRTTQVRYRKTYANWRCANCRQVSAEPDHDVVQVTKYWSIHDSNWVDLQGRMSKAEMIASAKAPASQHAMRELDWAKFVASLGGSPLDAVSTRRLRKIHRELKGGHHERLVRIRVGQRAFRQALRLQYGDYCAVTGSNPEFVLEAAHLYSYAGDPEHRPEGGLLLRRDIHRLFDLGLLGFNPERDFRIEVRSELHDTPYFSFHDMTPAVVLSEETRYWLARHHDAIFMLRDGRQTSRAGRDG